MDESCRDMVVLETTEAAKRMEEMINPTLSHNMDAHRTIQRELESARGNAAANSKRKAPGLYSLDDDMDGMLDGNLSAIGSGNTYKQLMMERSERIDQQLGRLTERVDGIAQYQADINATLPNLTQAVWNRFKEL